jgi:membrane-associated phospholipid phosphatase
MLPAAPLLRAVYATFQLQACLVPAILFATGHGERAWRFLLVVGVTLAATDVLFPIFPAQGAAVHFGLPQSYRAAVGDLSWHFPAVLNAIRAGAQTIDRTMLTGLVSFPSFHAAAALIYGWAVWPVRELRWPAILLNVGVCVSAVFVGAHYLVDVVAGLALASSVIGLCQGDRKAVFSRRSETIEVQGERARVKAG